MESRRDVAEGTATLDNGADSRFGSIPSRVAVLHHALRSCHLIGVIGSPSMAADFSLVAVSCIRASTAAQKESP